MNSTNIILYSTHCPKCAILEKQLKKKNIVYVENNNVDEMIKLGITSVPVLRVGDILMDFRTAWQWLEVQS